jgi:hypothetical protein
LNNGCGFLDCVGAVVGLGWMFFDFWAFLMKAFLVVVFLGSGF